MCNELKTEEEVAKIAAKIITKICENIKTQITDEFYKDCNNYLYEHYVNLKDDIDTKLIAEIEDKFIADPKAYKYLGLRKRIYEENKTEFDKIITEEVIKEGIENILTIYSNSNFPFSWKWKDGVVRAILTNWNSFKDDERVRVGFGVALDQKQARIEELEKKIREIEITLKD